MVVNRTTTPQDQTPSGVDQRFETLYLFATCRPGADETFALALPRVNADAMRNF